MTIEVEAWRRARHMEDATKVTQARFVFVATDKDRKPRWQFATVRAVAGEIVADHFTPRYSGPHPLADLGA